MRLDVFAIEEINCMLFEEKIVPVDLITD